MKYISIKALLISVLITVLSLSTIIIAKDAPTQKAKIRFSAIEQLINDSDTDYETVTTYDKHLKFATLVSQGHQDGNDFQHTNYLISYKTRYLLITVSNTDGHVEVAYLTKHKSNLDTFGTEKLFYDALDLVTLK